MWFLWISSSMRSIISSAPGLDGRTFHLTDPSPLRLGDMLNLFAGVAHAPKFTVRINAAMFGLIPATIGRG